MKKNPKYTIIVPAYNAEKYIEKCILSILNDINDNFELLVFNDASTDNTLSVLKNLKEKNPIIKIVNLDQNLGISRVRNLAVDLAKGMYIFFVDSDDTIPKGTFKVFEKIIIDFNAPDLILGAFNRVNDRNQCDLCNVYKDAPSIVTSEDLLKEVFYGNIKLYVWSGLIKSELLKGKGSLFPEGRRYEDIPVTTKMVLSARSIYITNIPTYNYFDNNQSITRKARVQDAEDILYGINDINEFIKEYPELKEPFFVFESNMMLFAYNILCKCDNEKKELGINISYELKKRVKASKNDLKKFKNSGNLWKLFSLGLYRFVIKMNYARKLTI